MKGNRIDLGLTGYNELFSSESSRSESKRPKIMDIPLSEIDDAPIILLKFGLMRICTSLSRASFLWRSATAIIGNKQCANMDSRIVVSCIFKAYLEVNRNVSLNYPYYKNKISKRS